MKLIREFSFDVKPTIITEANDGKGKSYYIEGIFLQAEQENRNGRVYPLHILQREVERYSEEYIKQNRALGELDHPECLVSDASVLTQTGFKPISQLTVGEKIYVATGLGVALEPITKVIISDYNGDVYRLSGKHIDTTVTPNHRFLVRDRYGKESLMSISDIDRDLPSGKLRHSYIVKSINRPENNEDRLLSTITIPRVGGKYKDRSDYTISMTTFCKFMGWYLAEGSCNYGGVSIKQNIGPKSNHLEQTLIELGLPYSRTFNMSEDPDRADNYTYHISNVGLSEYVQQFGICYDKFIPKEILENTTVEQKLEFLNSYALGDGRFRANGVIKDIFSTSQRMIEDLSVLAIKIGLGFKTYSRDQTDRYIGERLIKGENSTVLHFIEFYTTNGIYLDQRFVQIEKSHHEGKVYCIQVPSQNFFCKELNNQTYWSGNSNTVQLQKASHIVKDLRQEGNDFIGRAQILSTDMGRIAKAFIDDGVQLAVSSRGIGSLLEFGGVDRVDEDYTLTCIDLVADPSAHNAFVRGILEGKEWAWSGGKLVEKKAAEIKKQLQKPKVKQSEREAQAIALLQKFLKGL
jgi:hypothetical protein